MILNKWSWNTVVNKDSPISLIFNYFSPQDEKHRNEITVSTITCFALYNSSYGLVLFRTWALFMTTKFYVGTTRGCQTEF